MGRAAVACIGCDSPWIAWSPSRGARCSLGGPTSERTTTSTRTLPLEAHVSSSGGAGMKSGCGTEPAIRLGAFREKDHPLVPVWVAREDDETFREHPIQIAREHIVIHICCDLQSSLEHRSVLTPQTFQESSHHVEVRPLEVPPSHRFTGPRCTGSSRRGSGRSALSSRGGLSASPPPTDVSNVGKIESR